MRDAVIVMLLSIVCWTSWLLFDRLTTVRSEEADAESAFINGEVRT